MPDVLIQTPRGQMPCYLAVPPKPEPVPGVVVLHDVGGMSQDHRNQAAWLAEAGFLALAGFIAISTRRGLIPLRQPSSDTSLGLAGSARNPRFVRLGDEPELHEAPAANLTG